MTPPPEDATTRTAKVLALPTRRELLTHLLSSGPKTVKEIADAFGIHPNVARSHLDLMVEAGFLATETRRRDKGRPAKVYFTWEGEAGALSEMGVEVSGPAHGVTEGIELEVRVLERQLFDASRQLTRIKELLEETKRKGGPLD